MTEQEWLYEQQEREAIQIEGMRTAAEIDSAEAKQWKEGARRKQGIFNPNRPLSSELRRKEVSG